MEAMWQGVAIEASFGDQSALGLMRVVSERKAELEDEAERGQFVMYEVEVEDADIDKVVAAAERAMRSSWYIHLVNGGEMKIVFRGCHFDVRRGDPASLQAARDYALSHGVNEHQLPVEGFFDDPFS